MSGRHVPLCRDKQAAERMLRKLETDARSRASGWPTRSPRTERSPLAEHLDDYAAHLTGEGRHRGPRRADRRPGAGACSTGAGSGARRRGRRPGAPSG